MSRGLYVVVSAAAYVLFLATFLYLVAFVGDLPVPRTVDHGPLAPPYAAAAIDIALIALFGLQHSVMARPRFKASWTRIVPAPIERSVYLVFACLALILMFACWHPIGGSLWRVGPGSPAAIMGALFGLGWLIVLLSTFHLSHFELFGLKQVYFHVRGHTAEQPRLAQPGFYRIVRHPLYSGFVLAFWAAPAMSYGHLLLALGLTVYILIAIRYEEHDLVETFGDAYVAYREKVGMLTPRFRRSPR